MAFPKNAYGAIALTGGAQGALDAIDGAALQDLDTADVTTATLTYHYSLDEDSGLAESSPNVIAPDTNGGNKRWILLGALNQSLVTTGGPTFDHLHLTSGQVGFPATQVPSADANTLDDYEEGTWTPAIAFGGASVGAIYSGPTGGLYIKEGNLVTISGFLGLTAKGSSIGIATITGLPFVSENATGNTVAATLFLSGITFANTFMGFNPVNGAIIYLNEVTEAGVDSGLTNDDFADTSYIQFSLSYLTS